MIDADRYKDSSAPLAPGLYLVATPIGNLGDITLRALDVLRRADRIACEDTRQTQKLLNHFEIGTPTISCHEHNERQRAAELIEAIKAEASIRGVSLPADMAKAGISIDSLVVVSILCTVEPIVGFELPESVVRAGGYVSVESALGHLLPRIEQQWIKRKGAKP